ncbi:ABC transporter permease [Aquimarina gracilis]
MIRQKQFAFLNIVGLTLGIATCLVLGLYVYDEMTYDTFHEKGDRIYRVNQSHIWEDWNDQYASNGPNLGIALRSDVPEFEQITRLLDQGAQTMRTNLKGRENTLYKEEQCYLAEENFFEVFSFNFLQGNPKTALKDPKSIVITQKTAARYFGKENPIDKTLEIRENDGSWSTFTVTGVVANVSSKSHIQFDMLISLNSISERMKSNGWLWVWTGFSTYGLVKEGTNIEALRQKIQAIPPKWAANTTERIFNQTYDEFTAGKPWKLYLQPLRKIYLSDDPAEHRFGPNGNPQYVKLFSAIGILILVLSSINFMNLSTARSSKRSKEVGIRKVLGSERRKLIKLFILESTLFVCISTVFALIIVQLLLNVFNSIAVKELSLLSMLGNPVFLVILVSFVAFLGILAGSYPAFYLSAFKPIETLTGKVSAGFKGKKMRNGLVVVQFTISIALIICTFFVQKQLAYSSSLDLGLAKDNVLQIHNTEQLRQNVKVLKSKLEANSAFTHVGRSYGIPPYIWSGDRYKASESQTPAINLSDFRTEGDYLDLLGVEFLAGRNFDPERKNDKYGVILNEEAVKVLGWGPKETFAANSPIGKYVEMTNENEDKLEVLGVVKNFNFNSTKEKIAPLVILHQDNDLVWNYQRGLTFLSARLNPNVVKNTRDLQALIDDIKEEMAGMDASILFEYSFMDQEFEETFRTEQRMATVLNIFTVLALIIACLGLFGLTAFSAEQRIKELGIRKVLGAKVSQLALLFSSEFTKLVLISVLLASPIAYFLVDRWLTNFAYRTPIEIWVFAVALLFAVIITIITVSFQTIKIANTNPVNSLRTE